MIMLIERRAGLEARGPEELMIFWTADLLSRSKLRDCPLLIMLIERRAGLKARGPEDHENEAPAPHIALPNERVRTCL